MSYPGFLEGSAGSSDPDASSGFDTRFRSSISTADMNVNSHPVPPGRCPGFQDRLDSTAVAEPPAIRDIQPDSAVVRGGYVDPRLLILAQAVANNSALHGHAQCRASFGIISSSSFSVDFRNRCLLLALTSPATAPRLEGRHQAAQRAQWRCAGSVNDIPIEPGEPHGDVPRTVSGRVSRFLCGCTGQHHSKTTQGVA